MEFLRLFHQPQRLAISVRRRHAEISHQIFLQIFPLLLADHRHGSIAQHGDPAHDGSVVFEVTVSVQFKEVCKNPFNIVQRRQPVRLSGGFHHLPGVFLFFPRMTFRQFRLRGRAGRFAAGMHADQIRKYLSHLRAFHDTVDKPMLQKKLRPLEPFRKFLTDRLLDDSGTGKTDQSARLRQNDISQHGKTCRHPAGCGICQDRNV